MNWIREEETSDQYAIACRDNPEMKMWGYAMGNAEPPEQRTVPRRMPLGLEFRGTQDHFCLTTPNSHVLAIAPPQSHAGKTTSVMIPGILFHSGPVVTASTKMDVLRATAMSRAQHGEVWCYCPDGDLEHMPAGVRELRWSPISGADEWDTAIRTASAMGQTMDASHVTQGDYWKGRAADLLAPVFHWAALSGGTMRDARDAVYNHVTELPVVYKWLLDNHRDDAASMLHSIITAGTSRDAIASTAGQALAGYKSEGAMRSTDNENFDVIDFVNGGDYGVRADTIYIYASGENQNDVAPLVVGLLTQIQRAVYRRNRAINSVSGPGGTGTVPVLFSLDELYGLAPMPNLPNLLSEGGSQDVLVAAAVQDLSLIKSRWPTQAGAFMTLFRHVLVFPGVRDVETLEALSTLLGQHDVQQKSEQKKMEPTWTGWFGPRGHEHERTEHAVYSNDRRPRHDPDSVSRGPYPANEDALWHFHTRGWGSITATPYWRTAPWPHILTAYLWRALKGWVPEWRYWEAQQSGNRPEIVDVLPSLPLPRLTRWAEAALANPQEYHRCDVGWARAYQRAAQERDAILSQPPRQAIWEIPAENAGFNCVTRSDARLPKKKTLGSAHKSFPVPVSWGPAEEAQMSAWAERGGDLPEIYERTNAEVRAAIDVEKARRRELRDDASVKRFEAGMAVILRGGEMRPGSKAEAEAAAKADHAKGIDHGFWKWLPPELMRHMQSFLRGEGIAPHGESVPPGTAAPQVQNAFAFEGDWGPEDEAEMRKVPVGATFDQLPARYRALLERLEAAIMAEGTRRRNLGDDASVDRFDQERIRIAKAFDSDPDYRARCIAERDAAQQRGEDWSWWKWIAPQRTHIQAFLRGAGHVPGDSRGASVPSPTEGQRKVVGYSKEVEEIAGHKFGHSVTIPDPEGGEDFVWTPIEAPRADSPPKAPPSDVPAGLTPERWAEIQAETEERSKGRKSSWDPGTYRWIK